MNNMANQEKLDLSDLVPSDGTAAQEIGFSVPESYNASSILFENLDKGFGDKIALYSDEGNRTYRELCDEACRFGNALLSCGLNQGDRVMIVLNDGPHYPAAAFGAIRAGRSVAILCRPTGGGRRRAA